MTSLRGFSVAWLPAVLLSVLGLYGCEGSGGDNQHHSGPYYHGAGFYDPYYYGAGYYGGYDEVIIVPPPNNGNGNGGKPDRPGNGERPGNGLRPSHPIARPDRPSVTPMPSHRKPSIPSRARPASMGRSGMMRSGGMRGGGMRAGGRRR